MERIATFISRAFRVSITKATRWFTGRCPSRLRGTGWLDEAFHAGFREMMLHAAAREGLLCPTYCLMPDHIHLLWMGLRLDSDQRNGMKFLREHVGKLLRPHRFQHQPHDHVLREEERKREAFRKVCFYVIDNARVAELVKHPKDWQFAGAVVPGYPNLHPLEDDFWRLFWKLIWLPARPMLEMSKSHALMEFEPAHVGCLLMAESLS